MPQPPSYPGIYVEEVPGTGSRTIVGVETSVTAFVGHLSQGVADQPVGISSFADFHRAFGGLNRNSPLSYAVRHFFLNGGRRAIVVRVGSDGTNALKDDLIGTGPGTGMNALLETEGFNLLCIPETFDLSDADAAAVANAAIALCEASRAFYLVDPPKAKQVSDVAAWADALSQSRNAAVYFPAVQILDPLDSSIRLAIAPSGLVAGVYARTDNQVGTWKAPAGTGASLYGVIDLAIQITESQNAAINARRINALRSFPGRGHLVWGSRTMVGGNAQGDEYKYVPVRRLGLFIGESIRRGTLWTVFEPNDEATWSKVRASVSTFMHELFRAGALQGHKPELACFVHCGANTTTQSDIDNGLLNIQVGFAPSRPGEFLVIRIQQKVG